MQNFLFILSCKIQPTNTEIISLLIFLQGFDKKEGGGIELISHIITKQLHIPVSVLMGANLASEVAEEMFCETTIGKYLLCIYRTNIICLLRMTCTICSNAPIRKKN